MDVDRARHALDLAGRQPQGLAQVPHRPRAIRRERRDQRRAIRAVALVDPRDQLLTNVAREIEVDVGRLVDLLVQEPSHEQLALHGVDVGEAGQVARSS